MTIFQGFSFKKILPVIFMNLILSITYLVYWGGLDSPFIFDDSPNLKGMGQYEELGLLRDMSLFVLQGESGPTGRPISLASFFLDDYTWAGASAADFKYTNLMLHLLNGVLVFWLTLKLFGHTKLTQNSQQYSALIISGLWMLHPMQVNTVLYVIQRMTELSALFMLTGLLFYLYGRERLASNPMRGWLLLLVGGGISLLLAVLSKENGILMVVYILAIEYFFLRPHNSPTPTHLSKGLCITVWVPFILLMTFLVKAGWQNEGFSRRPFDAVERLMTETRILWDYIGNILLPDMQGNSLFHDDYIISRGLTEPFSTLPAIIGIILLITLMFFLRKHYAPLSFAIAWFLGGHLLESTTISLELYFEHRNYLPLYGPMVAIVYYAFVIAQRLPKMRFVIPTALAFYCFLILFITYQSARQWSQPVHMIAGWAQDHPNSRRTLEALDALIGEHISSEARQKLRRKLSASNVAHKPSSYIVLKNLELACSKTQIDIHQFDEALNTLQHSAYLSATPQAFADLVTQWLNNRCGKVEAHNMLAFIDKLRTMGQLQYGKMPQLLHYWQAEIQVTQGNLGATMRHHEAAYQLSPSLNSLLLQASYLTSAGLHSDAINKLKQAEKDLCTDTRSCLILKIRQPSIDKMMTILHTQLKQQKKADNHAQAIHYSTR